MRLQELTPVHVVYMPDELEAGKLYVSIYFNCSIHLCPCGCGEKIVLPFYTDKDPEDSIRRTMGWEYREVNGLVTFSPSVGNWKLPCRTHYFIENNKIRWA